MIFLTDRTIMVCLSEKGNHQTALVRRTGKTCKIHACMHQIIYKTWKIQTSSIHVF